MDTASLISRLNWFYTLELNQVDIYNAQSKTFKGRYSGLVFERLASIEQGHVDNLNEKIKELGGKPTLLGDLVSPLTGKVAGELIAMTGLEETLAINIMVEQKAMKDYSNLIETLQQGNYADQELTKLLQHNFVDEHLHTEWFRSKIIALKHQEYTAKPFIANTPVQPEKQPRENLLNDQARSAPHRTKFIKPRPVNAIKR